MKKFALGIVLASLLAACGNEAANIAVSPTETAGTYTPITRGAVGPITAHYFFYGATPALIWENSLSPCPSEPVAYPGECQFADLPSSGQTFGAFIMQGTVDLPDYFPGSMKGDIIFTVDRKGNYMVNRLKFGRDYYHAVIQSAEFWDLPQGERMLGKIIFESLEPIEFYPDVSF